MQSCTAHENTTVPGDDSVVLCCSSISFPPMVRGEGPRGERTGEEGCPDQLSWYWVPIATFFLYAKANLINTDTASYNKNYEAYHDNKYQAL